MLWSLIFWGPSIKYVTLEGGGGPRRCDSLWQRRVKLMWRHAYTNFYYTYETWNLKWCLTFCCNRCIVTEGGTDKNQPGQNPPWTIEIEFVQGTFVQDICTRPTKNWGWGVSEMCDVLSGGPGMCDKVWQGAGGSKLAKNSMTYFMDGPLFKVILNKNAETNNHR